MTWAGPIDKKVDVRACTCKCGSDQDVQRNAFRLVPCADCVDCILGSWVGDHLSDQASTSSQTTEQLRRDDFSVVRTLSVEDPVTIQSGLS